MKYVFTNENEEDTPVISHECVTPDEFLQKTRRLMRELDEMLRQMKRVFAQDEKRFQKYLESRAT